MMSLHLGSALIWLALLVPFAAPAQAPTGDKALQTVNPPPEIPRFYAESRQVIVEAEVWDKTYNKGDRPWIGDESLRPAEKDALRGLPPPARGLTLKDFHVFDNGAEQSINYFKEADFPAVDITNRWWFVPTPDGTWGSFENLNSWTVAFPSATYLIGYVPPAIKPGECRTIKVVVEGHEVGGNRNQYCAPSGSESPDIEMLAGKKLGTRMRKFATSAARGSIKVSTQAFAFWSSGVLRLATGASPTGSTATLPATDYTYMVEVHDSKAPTTVQIAAEFDFPEKLWYYPWQRDAALYVLVIVYKTDGGVAGQFADTFPHRPLSTFFTKPLKQYFPGKLAIPSRFDTQVELSPGNYELSVVVSDGKNLGRARMPLRVEPFYARRLMMSDVVVGGVLRDAGWVLHEVADVSPAPVVPSPLVSKNVQFFPDPDTPPRLQKHTPLFLYFEIYEPQLKTEAAAVCYSIRITDLKTGSLVMNTGPMSAADWVQPGNVVLPIGLKLATDKLRKGSYRLEVQASDSTGRESEWRQAIFTIE